MAEAAPYQKKKKSGKLHEPPTPKPERVFNTAAKQVHEKLNDKEEVPQKTPGELFSTREENGIKKHADKYDLQFDLKDVSPKDFKTIFKQIHSNLQKNYFDMADLCEDDPSLKPYLIVVLKMIEKMGEDFGVLLRDNIKK